MIREGSIQLPFTFAAGKAASEVLTAIEERQVITGSTCPSCNLTVAPARSFCPECCSADLTTMEAGPGGVLQAWSEVPGRSVFGLVLLDGTDRPMAHRILGPISDLAVGARVTASFGPSADDPLKTELSGFEPAEGGS